MSGIRGSKKSIWDVRFDNYRYAQDDDIEGGEWRTINGSHVHINSEGVIDAGADGKFNGQAVKKFERPAFEKYSKTYKRLEARGKSSMTMAMQLSHASYNEQLTPDKAEEVAQKFTDGLNSDIIGVLKRDEYENPPQKLESPMKEKDAIKTIGGQELDEQDQGHCASLSMAFIANQELGLDVRDFRGGISQLAMSYGADIPLGEMSASGFDPKVDGGGIVQQYEKYGYEINGELCDALENMQPGRNYVCIGDGHQALVRKTKSGEIQYLELQGKESKLGWHRLCKSPKAEPNERIRRGDLGFNFNNRFGMKLGKDKMCTYCGIVPADKYAQTEYFKSRINYVNTAEENTRKVK